MVVAFIITSKHSQQEHETMTTSLLMSKIIDLTDARRNRRVTRRVGEPPRFDLENRKEYRRISTERLFVQVVEASDPELVGTTLSCHTLDVSSGGLRVQCSEYIPEGCQLDLWIDNSARPGKFFLTSDVRWVMTVDDQYEMGVALHEGSATDIDEWRQLLASG